MREKMRKIFCLAVVCLLTAGMNLGFPVLVAAETVGNVYDDAELLTQAEAENLNTQIEELKSETGWEIFAVTTSYAEGKSAMAYADDFFDIHAEGDADGVALLIDMDNREIYISTCGEAIRYLTDARIEQILDDSYGYAGDADYSSCFAVMLGGVESAYQKGIVDGQYNYDTETGEISYYHSLTAGEVVVVLLLAAIVAGIVYASVLASYRLKLGTYSYDFHKYGNVHLIHSDDRLVNQMTTHRHIQTESSSGGSSHHSNSSMSSTHHSSSGSTHGGGGHKF